ncbi:MAG: ATP-binding protein [Candidatus Methanomethylicia archaeon]
MIQLFINREDELNFLERKYLEDSAQLIIIYGRRRIGKTELIKKFIQGKNSVYFLCTHDSLQENLKGLKTKFYELTGREYFLKLEVNSFFDLFKYLIDEIRDKKVVIVLDEFPYLIEINKGIVSVFQKIWDELLVNKKIFLVICGSSIGIMETEILNYRSPLYGRRTGEWNVGPLRFKDIALMFKTFPVENLVKLWAIYGGVPFYLIQIDPKKTIEENIKLKILSKGEVLYNEPIIILREEFREPRIYMLILKYLSIGYNTQGALTSAIGINKGNLSKYLATLEETKLVKYVLPLGQRKRGIYIINDPFFNFWFRFVYPNLSDLELGLVDEVFSRISTQINSYYGLMFEQLIFDLVSRGDIELPLQFNEVRKWWYKDKEIDLIALNEHTREILFAECKWSDQVDAERTLKGLRWKTQYINWHNEERREYYAIFAKSFKEKIEEPRLILFDLKDLEKTISRRLNRKHDISTCYTS